MKSGRLLIALLIVCLLGGYLYLGSGYFQQEKLRSALASQINDTSHTLSLAPKPASDLDNRLAEAEQANLLVRQKMAPGKADATQIIDEVFQAGDKVKLKITPLATNPWTEKKVSGNTYRLMNIELKVEGDFPDLLAFIRSLEDRESFPSLAIESITVSRPGAANGNSTQEELPEISADITIVIFNLAAGSK